MDAKDFAEFTERLKYHNRGAGVDDHCTANPIFIVQSLNRVCGIDLDYDPLHYWTDNDHEVELTDDELEKALKEYTSEGGEFERYHTEIKSGPDTLYEKIGYADQWEYECAHLTKEGAETFINRKLHDHRALRIFVDSQYWCWEFNKLIDGILDGKIGIIS